MKNLEKRQVVVGLIVQEDDLDVAVNVRTVAVGVEILAIGRLDVRVVGDARRRPATYCIHSQMSSFETVENYFLHLTR